MRIGHDGAVIAAARAAIDELTTPLEIRDYLLGTIEKHRAWRAADCINLVAAEAPASDAVRGLLATDLGSRASGGHIGRSNRYFAGLDYADQLEALCVVLLTVMFQSRYADQRLLGGMHGDMIAFSVLKRLGARRLMSINPKYGGDTSNRLNGPPGVLGMEITDIPVEPDCLTIDVERFEAIAKTVRPDIVSLGAGLTLFPYPVREIKRIIERWGGRVYFDGAHQAGLIAAGCYPNPLAEGADILTGSSGKTFSGPQGGLICWNDDDLSDAINDIIFPTLTGTHQLNRVAALAMACLEQMTFGREYMSQVVRNAQSLAAALASAGLRVIGAGRGFTVTHQVAIDVSAYGGGHVTALRLAEANLIANKVSLPTDADEEMTGGLRLGTVEVTRLGMIEDDMQAIADLIVDVLLGSKPLERVKSDVIALRKRDARMYYDFENGWPPRRQAVAMS